MNVNIANAINPAQLEEPCEAPIPSSQPALLLCLLTGRIRGTGELPSLLPSRATAPHLLSRVQGFLLLRAGLGVPQWSSSGVSMVFHGS